MKNKIRLIPVLLTLAVTLTSCENFLDVEPKSQIKDQELFSSEAGFKEALAGVYSTLVDEKLYTREMTFGMIAVLAREWTNYSNNTYPYATDYNYSVTKAEKAIAGVWETLYHAIANANVILEVIDDKQSVFSGHNYSIIKGEALALRAFCHFDLLRCFGVSYAVNPDMPAIPYVKEYISKVTPQLTVDQAAAEVVADLRRALQYLEVDPIFTGQQITELDDNGYLINRQLHLNYYAVKGLLARVYLYMGEYTLAAREAEEVVNSGVFDWVSQGDMAAANAPSAASEQLWGIDVNNLSYLSSEYFSPTISNNQREKISFSISAADRNTYYENVPTDYRYLYLFRQNESFAETWYTRKFDTSSLTSGAAYYNNKIAMIRLPEMYFILAECYYHTEGDWLAMLSEVSTARGAYPFTSVSDLNGTLVAEYRKELLGEGQLFYLYKRLNMTNIYGIGSDLNLVGLKAYTFPLPESELRAANRQDNR